MNARTKGSILIAAVIVAVIGSGAAVSGGGDAPERKAPEVRSESPGTGSAVAPSESAYLRALRIRGEALNRQYGLGAWEVETGPASQEDDGAYLRALRVRGEALNKQYKLGRYAPRS